MSDISDQVLDTVATAPTTPRTTSSARIDAPMGPG